MIDLDDVRLVAAFAAEGSARRAAARLRCHVATFYRQLRALETRLGATLFERHDGRFVVTALAAEIVDAADNLQATLDTLERRVAGHDGRLTGHLAVTTTDTLVDLVVEAIAPFCDAHPELVVNLSIGNAMADLTRHDADVAIRPTISPPETLIGRKVGSFTFGRYAARAGLEPWIGFDDSLADVPAARWLADHGEGSPRLRCNSLWAAARAAKAGLGWAVLPDYLAARSGLVRLGAPIADLNSVLWLLYHADFRQTPRVRYFVRDVSPRLAALLSAYG